MAPRRGRSRFNEEPLFPFNLPRGPLPRRLPSLPHVRTCSSFPEPAAKKLPAPVFSRKLTQRRKGAKEEGQETSILLGLLSAFAPLRELSTCPCRSPPSRSWGAACRSGRSATPSA